jgi:DNA-binding NarL/FixJ family response regulator
MSRSELCKNVARILIVDDHPTVREGLTARISRQDDMEVCGEVADGEEALVKVKELRPDVAVVDISLPKGHGIDLIKQIRAHHDHVKTIVHSMYEESLYAERALQAGAMGYVNKREAPETLLDAIRQVLVGEVYLSPKMTGRVLNRTVGRGTIAAASPIESLSDRELEVFNLIGQGLTTRAIANRLHLSVHTIDTHREKIKRKLGLKNSAELMQRAVQWVLENG